MAAKCAHESYYLVGEVKLLKNSVVQILPHWGERMPYYGFLLGMGAFGYVENGDYEEAENMGRKAVEIEPRDSWAVHAVAHVMQMQGRCAENINWLESRRDFWHDAIWLNGHLWWHLCLPLLEIEQFDRVLEIYDAHMAHCENDMVNRLIDCASMLWRLDIFGVNIGRRWEPLAEKWISHSGEHAIAFTDVHFAITMAAAGWQNALKLFTESQYTYSKNNSSTNAEIIKNIGSPLCKGINAYQNKKFSKAADHIGPVLDETWRIGGSNAQRDIFRLAFTSAALKANRFEEARKIMEPFVETNATPSSLRQLAAAYEGTGRKIEAEALRQKADTFRG